MNRIKLVAVLAVLGIGTFVLMSSIYTVSDSWVLDHQVTEIDMKHLGIFNNKSTGMI